MKMKKTVIAGFCSSLLAGYPCMVQAEENNAEFAQNGIAELDIIEVTSGEFSQQVGTQKVTEEEIERRPTTNGAITDLLKTNPSVRFSVESENSNTGGEIKPSEVSFHGEKYYNNNFIINGMSNNDNINPGSDSGRLSSRQPQGSNAYDLPGGDTQSFWIDSSLLKSVEVFDSNISAEYGNFSGGVVDAKLKDPEFKHAGKIHYRHTRDDWSKFHVDDDSAFAKANRLDFQPEFTKQQYGIMLNQNFGEKLALRFNYTRTDSDITYYHPLLRMRNAEGVLGTAGEVRNDQRRLAETYMLNAIYLPDNGDLWRWNVTYAPHSAKYFKQSTVNGAFTNTGGGVQTNVEWEKQFDDLKMISYFGYKYSGNKIEHESNIYNIFQQSANIGWASNDNGVASEGGFGSFRTEKATYTAKQKFEQSEFDWGNTQHKVSFGWEIDVAKVKYVRENDAYNRTYTKSNYFNIVCNGAEACIDSDQYAYKQLNYYARSVKGQDNKYSAYIQDSVKWGKLSFVAGLRYDYNQFLGKHNFAPRLSGTYDLFGDQKTRLFAGYNRYYDGSILSYKMSQDISNYLTCERNLYADGTLSDWLPCGQAYNNTYDVSKLKNPYADEYVLGLGQKLFGLDWTFKWVNRHKKQDLTRTTAVNEEDYKYSTLSNNGWTKNDTFSFTLKPEKAYEFDYAKVGIDLGISFNRTRTNSRWYNAEDTSNAYLIYNKQLSYALGGSMPTDFNNPYRVNLSVNTEFPKWRITWDQRFSYVGGKDYIYSEGTFTCNGANTSGEFKGACGQYVGEVDLYKDAHQASHFLIDWRIGYTQPLAGDQKIELTLDINNVLNKRAVAKGAGGNTVYKMGRNFWLGASYAW